MTILAQRTTTLLGIRRGVALDDRLYWYSREHAGAAHGRCPRTCLERRLRYYQRAFRRNKAAEGEDA